MALPLVWVIGPTANTATVPEAVLTLTGKSMLKPVALLDWTKSSIPVGKPASYICISVPGFEPCAVVRPAIAPDRLLAGVNNSSWVLVEKYVELAGRDVLEIVVKRRRGELLVLLLR